MTWTTNFWEKKKKKKKKMIVYNMYFLEFVTVKFNVNLAFVRISNILYRLEKRIYIVYKIYTVFRANTWTSSHKNVTSL